MIKLKVKNQRQFNAQLAAYERQVDLRLISGMKLVGIFLSGQIIKSIQTGVRTGRAYVNARSKKGNVYRKYLDTAKTRPAGKVTVASARGENPKTDTGTLVKSVDTNPKVTPLIGAIISRVRVKADYAKNLENKLDRPIVKDKVNAKNIAASRKILARSLKGLV